MISSQKRDGVFTFNMHANPILSVIVDNFWRKDSFKDINIFIPDNAKFENQSENFENNDPIQKFPLEKMKEWSDIGIQDLLGKYIDMKEIDKKDKQYQ